MSDSTRLDRHGPPAEAVHWLNRMDSRHLTDVVIAALVAVVPVLFIAVAPGAAGHPLNAADIVSAGIAAVVVMLGRRHPAPMLAVGLASAVIVMGVAQQRTALTFAIWVVLYALAVRSNRTVTVTAGIVVAGLLYGATVVFLDTPPLDSEAVAPIAWSGLAAAVGDAVRHRRAFLAEVEDRIQQAEQTRETEVRRQVAEERLRIARDLHDVVAHRMTVISVQSAVADQRLHTDPQGAQKALTVVQQSAREVLDELTNTLHVLRTGNGDDPASELTVDPTPMLTDLPTLVDSFANAGLKVSWDTSGADRPTPATVQIAAYRVVQEGLTNAQRHGDGQAHLDISSTPGALIIRIVNRSQDTTAVTNSGLGLVGMRERVESVGGTLTAAARPDGCFEVVARLPIPADAAPMEAP